MQIPSLGLRFLMRKLQPVSGGVWGLGKLMPTECSEQTQHLGVLKCLKAVAAPMIRLPSQLYQILLLCLFLILGSPGWPWLTQKASTCHLLEQLNLPPVLSSFPDCISSCTVEIPIGIYHGTWNSGGLKIKPQIFLFLPLSSPLVFVNDITVYP